MTNAKTLLMMRHAQAEDVSPAGRDDKARSLTAHGREQAAAVGDYLRAEALQIGAVLFSTALRARQTLESTALAAPVEFSESLYTAGGDDVLAAITELDPGVSTALILGHAPAIPSAVLELSDPATSNSEALQLVEVRFPPATVALLRFDQPWTELGRGALEAARLPDDGA
jgi:phosphohistidine phosphatase